MIWSKQYEAFSILYTDCFEYLEFELCISNSSPIISVVDVI